MRALVDNLMKSIPTHVIRYEDLMEDQGRIISQLFCFLLDVPSIEGTIVEKRIQEIDGTVFERNSQHLFEERSADTEMFTDD